MINVIVAFSRPEHAKSMKNILVRSGFSVDAVVTTGAQALQYANSLGEGILVCGPKFVDMMYEELREYLPHTFQMLLLAPPDVCRERAVQDVMCLAMPLKVHELISTMETMSYTITRMRKKRRMEPKVRSAEEQLLLSDAKELLMARNNMTEEEAHRYIQKRSMDNGTGLVETAQMILSLLHK